MGNKRIVRSQMNTGLTALRYTFPSISKCTLQILCYLDTQRNTIYSRCSIVIKSEEDINYYKMC